MTVKPDEPSLRIAITGKCNLACQYCPADGDSVRLQQDEVELETFVQLVGAAFKAGIRKFSITGGEPLRRPGVVFALASHIRALPGWSPSAGYLKLNTNGALLSRHLDSIGRAGFSELKVSIDTLNPSTFQDLTRRPRRVLAETTDGVIQASQLGVPIRLQTVVGNYNIGELDKILAFCQEHGFDIKLFDISDYKDSLAVTPTFWKDNYVPLESVADMLAARFPEVESVNAVGGYGHKMRVFETASGSRVQLRDTSSPSHFSKELCDACPEYICQDGLCNLVVAADGHIRFCRAGGDDQTFATRSPKGQALPESQMTTMFEQSIGIFQSSRPVARVLPVVQINGIDVS